MEQPQQHQPPAGQGAVETLWTAKDLATYLQVSLSWVRHETAAGRLPVVRFGAFVRYDPVDIAEYVRGRWKPRRG